MQTVKNLFVGQAILFKILLHQFIIGLGNNLDHLEAHIVRFSF